MEQLVAAAGWFFIFYVQYRALQAIVRFRDGRVMGKIVEIPHRYLAQAVCVEFP